MERMQGILLHVSFCHISPKDIATSLCDIIERTYNG